jgi:sodium/bile acid cotransporter 7
VKRFLLQRWFLIALFTILAIGISGAELLAPIVANKTLRDCVVASVLFLMALPLEASAMWRSMSRPWPPLLAVAINFGLLPLFAWSVSLGLDPVMAPGLLVAAATPCTLASASVWTRRAGGNDSVSILVTIMTNATCFFVTPMWLLVMTGRTIDNPDLSLSKMAMKLGLLVVLPMMLAQFLRLRQPLAKWATSKKSMLSVFAQCGILSMVFFGAIRTGLRLGEAEATELAPPTLIAMFVAVCVVHTTMLVTGLWLARLFRFSREDQIAVAFASSQKTLMVGLLMAMSLQVSILPMVTYHVMQLLIDTLIADRFRRQSEIASNGSAEDC